MPASVSHGATTLYVARDLKPLLRGNCYDTEPHALSSILSHLKVGLFGSRKCSSLADAFKRMVAVFQLDHAINGSYDGLPVLAGVYVAVRSLDDELKFGVDESYKLTMPATGNPIYARIEAGETDEVITPKHKIPRSDIIIEKDGFALTDATTNAKRFEPSVPIVVPTTVGKKGRK